MEMHFSNSISHIRQYGKEKGQKFIAKIPFDLIY
ncbi:hypothetical protein B0O79_0022 [Flavobacteriaceae bacterium MAR_2009_75]|nr:hypothetical protein B0O79_0022 [Flavobacteriaceae bacterium MAR_2009_75]